MTEPESSAAREHERRVDLVFEGGGIKGIGLVGALSVLEERGYQPQNVAGSSAGAIVATMLAAGYTATELRDIIRGLNFTRFTDPTLLNRIPLIGPPLCILKNKGIFQGEEFLSYLRELLTQKGVRTFGDLVHPTYANDPNPLYRHKAQIIASDVTERRLLVLPRDAEWLGVQPNDLEVAYAVRMSMSLPIFFEPARFRNPATGRHHLIVDGGMLSNFPVWLFDAPGVPDWPTFGLKLVEPEPTQTTLADRLPPAPARRRRVGLVPYVKSLVQTMSEAHDRLYLEKTVFVRTIPVPTLGVRTTEFDLTQARVTALYDAGRTAAEEFLATWDFDAYIAEFRSGKTHSRRQEIAAELATAKNA